MARASQHTVLLGLILLTSVVAFSPTTAGTVVRPLMSQGPYRYARLHRLHAEPSPDEPTKDDMAVVAKAPSAHEDGDPRQALEKFGSLFSQVQLIVTEGSTWDSEVLEDKTREFVTSYVGVVVPGLGYVATSIAVYVSSFAFIGVLLALSGRGYNDILAAADGIGPLRDLLEKADPTWGNAAIVLVALEVLSPAIIGVTLALTPKMMDALRTNLDGWGWGEEGIADRVAEIMGK